MIRLSDVVVVDGMPTVVVRLKVSNLEQDLSYQLLINILQPEL